MKTRLDLNNRRRRRPKLLGATLVVLACLFLVVVGPKLLAPLGRAGLYLSSPVIRTGDYLFGGVRSFSSVLRFKKSLLAENFALRQQISELEAMMANYHDLETDNRILKEEVSIRSVDPSLEIVELLSHPWNSPFDVVLVAVSAPEKISVGDRVTYKKNVWAGEVAEKLGGTAKVKLLSAPGTEVPVLVGENNIPGLASGRGNGNLSISLPRSLAVEPGDLVRAASTTASLLVGTVGAVDKDPGESLQTILVRTPVNLSFIRYLEINGR